MALNNLEEASFQLANHLYHQGNFSESVSEYNKIICRNPNEAITYAHLGLAYLALENFNDAIEAYHVKLRLEPDYASHINLGYALFRKGEYEASRDECLKAVALNPKNAWAYFNLGSSLSYMAHFEKEKRIKLHYFSEASKALAEVATLRPHWAGNYFALGVIEYCLHNYSAAIAMFREALKLDPDELIFYVGLSKAQFFSGRWIQAWKTFDKWNRMKMEIEAKGGKVKLGERYNELIGPQPKSP